MAEQSNINPHIRDKNSPLQTLALQALRRFGDFHPGTVDGDVMLMFIEFANMVIDDVRVHPYHNGKEIDYYTSATDIREVPDPIIVQGLLYHYAFQQASDKVSIYMPMYNKILNQHLWHQLNGNTKIQMKVRDGGTNKRNAFGSETSNYNGTVTFTKGAI